MPFDAKGHVTPASTREEGPYSSHTPKYIFADTLEEQEAQLKTNPLIQRFAESREKLASDPYRPAYHFVSPENMLNDPNRLGFGKGIGTFFIRAIHPTNFPIPKISKSVASTGAMR